MHWPFLKCLVQRLRLGALIQACAIAACWFYVSEPAWGQNLDAAAPRSAEDILAVLDQYKPDPEARAKAVNAASALPPSDADALTLIGFYRHRARAANQIGLVKQRIDDLREAAKYVKARGGGGYNILTELYNAELSGGNFLNAINIMAASAGTQWQVFESYTELASAYAFLGDTERARQYLANAEDVMSGISMLPPGKHSGQFFSYRLHEFKSRTEHARGELLSSEGKFAEAEAAYRKAVAEAELDLAMQKERSGRGAGEFAEDFESVRDNYESLLALALMRQYQLSEAEIVARRVLDRTLRRTGRYSVDAANTVRLLSSIVFEQGRFRDAELLAAAAIESFVNAGTAPESLNLAGARKVLGGALVAQRRWSQALENYSELYQGLQHDPELARRYDAADTEWALALVKTGQAAKAVAMLEDLLARLVSRFGDADVQAVEARGYLAIALAAQGNRERALVEFRRAVPMLLDQARAEQSSESGGIVRTMRLTNVLEAYLDLLGALYQARQGGQGVDLLAESFRIADAARGSNVQRALVESAARASLPDPGLADLARQEQDAQQHIGALRDLLSRLLAAPADQQLAGNVAEVRKEIDALRAAHARLKQEIERRFPGYANLVNPTPATIEQTKAALGPGEAMVSIYTGETGTYVWALSKAGAVAFARAPVGRTQLDAKVMGLRRGLDLHATTLGGVPQFDVALAYELYAATLQPVEAGWKGAKTIIVAPHGPLGQIPFSLLVTRPVPQPQDQVALFSGYREVPFLVREVAVYQVPSVAALVTLRGLAAGNTTRLAFVGFGDPWFSAEQAAQARAEQSPTAMVDVRGFHLRAAPATETLSSATLAMLPRLPDTALEVREVAATLRANPATDVFLGVSANERQVRTMKLDDRRVVMFATHGLVPGDLDGLDQPALALTAPTVAKVDGDGLLTMEKILGLKLDADWVVLSACNTAAGQGAGAEAVSGLGRAFFYAGARALLVTNWPVETTAAGQLTTGTFKRQAADLTLTRAEALRQSMLELIDSPGYIDPATKRVAYSYAHPIFWAPFALVGDGR